ncbi:hypothetical protein FA15DRAFT_661933 [Coprinopsis marcescibilis]|uniref:Uncharacterized protein n=1 Tax=Coprinopsis marcescibilis TaxID=230819 RepID=A0A5C3K9L7_COPMA|nr:hypothetical protein FA15DRAFT_661933 [Coprinopsis marcescibilis]
MHQTHAVEVVEEYTQTLSSLNGVAEEPREGCTNRCSDRRRRKKKLGGDAALLDDVERRGWGLGWADADGGQESRWTILRPVTRPPIQHRTLQHPVPKLQNEAQVLALRVDESGNEGVRGVVIGCGQRSVAAGVLDASTFTCTLPSCCSSSR